MKREQIVKLLKVTMITTLILLVFEIIFAHSTITNFFGNLISSSSGWVSYLIIWLIMFAQVTILNIPAYVILSASVSIGISTLSWEYILTVISAYMAGAILAYFIGFKFGKKAVKWCAGSEEDYDKWCNVLNSKGKWYYFATVVFPLFPDDLLCIVAGSVKFNFGLFSIFNLVGRTIGLITMLYTLKLIGSIGGGFPYMVIVWAVALLAETIAYFILKRRLKNESSDNREQD